LTDFEDIVEGVTDFLGSPDLGNAPIRKYYMHSLVGRPKWSYVVCTKY